MRIPRSRGAVTGVLLVIAGLWGGLIPFVGPTFGLAIGNDASWDWTTPRFWLSVLPAIAVVLGGLILLRSAHRAGAGLGAWLALAGGAWFVVGQPISELWNHGTSDAGRAIGGTGRRVLEELTFFYGLGALVVALAAFALGRLAVRSVRDAELEREAEVAAAREDVRHRTGRHDAAAPVRNGHDRDADGIADEHEPATTTSTASAADRVRAAASDEPRRGRFFRRNRV